MECKTCASKGEVEAELRQWPVESNNNPGRGLGRVVDRNKRRAAGNADGVNGRMR